jgi:hypothetical protein
VALEVEAINPVRLGLFPPNLLFIFARWEVTCGFCRTRFRRTVLDLMVGSKMSWIACTGCGTHNLLPHHPDVRTKGR